MAQNSSIIPRLVFLSGIVVVVWFFQILPGVTSFQALPLFSSPRIASHRLFRTNTLFGQVKGTDNNNRTPNEEDEEEDPFSFAVGVLGDLHIDPRKIQDYKTGRQEWLQVLREEQVRTKNVAMVSLGDLGESKYCDHNPHNTDELFSGTSLCHDIAAAYLSSFQVPYEVIGGNHDLEGIDEFLTDEENLAAFLKAHDKPTPQFCREIAEKTLLVGLGSTVFRDAPYTSHEVIIDQNQIDWFENLLQKCPAQEGWKVFVFTHAPPNGSGLRVLQENHVVNGCCWLNHSNEDQCRKFIELVREHRCIKAWFSGHFHLGQDYQDSITFPAEDNESREDRGSCVFVQTSVMRDGTSRDGRQQSRLIRGNLKGFEICTVDHKKGGEVRIDATVTYQDDQTEVGVYAHDDEAFDHDDYFKVYTPQVGDEGHIKGVAEKDLAILAKEPIDVDSKAWWRLSSGRVLGMCNGMLLEYDKSTLAPLGLVVSKDELIGKKIAVVEATVETGPDEEENAERDQAVLMYDRCGSVTVIQPNEDGSYWRKIVRNKIARMAEKRREKAAARFAEAILNADPDDAEEQVLSSWGPYTTTSGQVTTTQVLPEEVTTADCKPNSGEFDDNDIPKPMDWVVLMMGVQPFRATITDQYQGSPFLFGGTKHQTRQHAAACTTTSSSKEDTNSVSASNEEGNNHPPVSTSTSPSRFPRSLPELFPSFTTSLTNLGLSTPTPIQASSAERALRGENLLLIAATGSGKTLAYLLPALTRAVQQDGTVLVLAPTRELAVQLQKDTLDLLLQNDQEHVATPENFQQTTVQLCVRGLELPLLDETTAVLIGTPQEMVELLRSDMSSFLRSLSAVVLDEVDVLLPAAPKRLRTALDHQKTARTEQRQQEQKRKLRAAQRRGVKVDDETQRVLTDTERLLGMAAAIRDGSMTPQVLAGSATASRKTLDRLNQALRSAEKEAIVPSEGAWNVAMCRPMSDDGAESIPRDRTETQPHTIRAVTVPPEVSHRYIELSKEAASDPEHVMGAVAKAYSVLQPKTSLLFLCGEFSKPIKAEKAAPPRELKGATSQARRNARRRAQARGLFAQMEKKGKQKQRPNTQRNLSALKACKLLADHDIVAEPLHVAMGLEQNAKSALQKDEDDDDHFLVTFEGSARGLHLDAVDAVFIVGRPSSVAAYMHLAGRVGRASPDDEGNVKIKPGTVVSMCTTRSSEELEKWIQQVGGLDLSKLEI